MHQIMVQEEEGVQVQLVKMEHLQLEVQEEQVQLHQ